MAEDKPKAKAKPKAKKESRPTTRNTNRRAVNQQSLRELLQAQGHLQHVTDLLDEFNDEKNEITGEMIHRKKVVIDTKLKLINKYLPDLKSVEMSGGTDDTVTFKKPEWLK